MWILQRWCWFKLSPEDGVAHEIAGNVLTYGCGLPFLLELAGDSADVLFSDYGRGAD